MEPGDSGESGVTWSHMESYGVSLGRLEGTVHCLVSVVRHSCAASTLYEFIEDDSIRLTRIVYA